MAQKIIDTTTNNGSYIGDPAKTAFRKCNENFTEIYGRDGVNGVRPISNGGTGATTAAGARSNLELGTAAMANVGTADGNVMTVGAFGLGSPSGGPSGAPDSSFRPGFYRYPVGASGAPYGDSAGSLLVNTLGGNYVQQIAITPRPSTTNPWVGCRHFDGGGNPGPWVLFYHSGNTTRATDGTLRAASPVVRIANVAASLRPDLNELDFEPAGAWGVANAEALGVTVQRLDVGVYQISGCLGLAKEGWRVIDPASPDGGRPLGITDSEQAENGTVTIRLFKQRWTLSDDGEMVLGKGAALDVPLNSWIDVRLSMPAPPDSLSETE